MGFSLPWRLASCLFTVFSAKRNKTKCLKIYRWKTDAQFFSLAREVAVERLLSTWFYLFLLVDGVIIWPTWNEVITIAFDKALPCIIFRRTLLAYQEISETTGPRDDFARSHPQRKNPSSKGVNVSLGGRVNEPRTVQPVFHGVGSRGLASNAY